MIFRKKKFYFISCVINNRTFGDASFTGYLSAAEVAKLRASIAEQYQRQFGGETPKVVILNILSLEN